jgi:hypothetical protein
MDFDKHSSFLQSGKKVLCYRSPLFKNLKVIDKSKKNVVDKKKKCQNAKMLIFLWIQNSFSRIIFFSLFLSKWKSPYTGLNYKPFYGRDWTNTLAFNTVKCSVFYLLFHQLKLWSLFVAFFCQQWCFKIHRLNDTLNFGI